MKKTFLTGLATLLPVAVTLWIIVYVVRFLTNPFMGIVTHFLTKTALLIHLTEKGVRTLSQILILTALFLFTLTLGFIARRFFFHQILQMGDFVLQKIPLVNKVYKIAKEIVQSLLSPDQNSFKQVVMIPFPYKGCYLLGIVTSNAPASTSKAVGEEMISVFIPTTPNPTTGYLIISPKSDLIFLKMKSDEAIKYVVSFGVIRPRMEKLLQ